MFTGLIESVGTVLWLRKIKEATTQLVIAAPELAKSLSKGDSLAVNGCCLTVTSRKKDHLAFDLLDETLQKTNLGDLRPDSPVNLERSMAADGRFGGHIVQGHVDCACAVISFEPVGPDHRLEVVLPGGFTPLVAYKGSVAIDGTSLTVAEVLPESFVVWLIPHTLKHTNLHALKPSFRVNLEFDILAKYVQRQLAANR